MFCNVSKVVLCGRRNTFATFLQDALQFSWQAQHFGRVHRHFAWQALHLRRVLLRVFCESHVRAVSSGDKVQIPWQAWHFVRFARNIDFEVANLVAPTKTRRKTSILKLQSVNIGGSLARNARFDAPTCLISSHGFPGASCGLAVSVYRGSCKTSPFRRFPSRLSCRFAWQARHFVTFQPV